MIPTAATENIRLVHQLLLLGSAWGWIVRRGVAGTGISHGLRGDLAITSPLISRYLAITSLRRRGSNAVLSGSTFANANLKDTDWTDAYIGDFDQRKLCKNPSLQGENPVTGAPTRESAGWCADARVPTPGLRWHRARIARQSLPQ